MRGQKNGDEERGPGVKSGRNEKWKWRRNEWRRERERGEFRGAKGERWKSKKDGEEMKRKRNGEGLG